MTHLGQAVHDDENVSEGLALAFAGWQVDNVVYRDIRPRADGKLQWFQKTGGCRARGLRAEAESAVFDKGSCEL